MFPAKVREKPPNTRICGGVRERDGLKRAEFSLVIWREKRLLT